MPALPTKPMEAADRARVSAIVREQLENDQYKAEVPGFVIGIWSPTQGVYRASFGQADLKSAAKPKLGSNFRIGSVSKTFTATVILELVDEGKLSLNGTVKQYVPGLARKYPGTGSRTVAQLLGMRSGLPEYTDAAVKYFTRAPQRIWTADQLIALAMQTGPVKPAGGAKSVYTNTNYVLLGQIAQAVTGTRMDRLVQQRLLGPLGLRHTIYPAATRTRLPEPLTHGYIGPSGAEEIKQLGGTTPAGTDVTNWNPSWGNAAGMMSSTIDDLARWSNGMFGNALLPSKLRKQRLVTTPMSDTLRYGLGIFGVVGSRWVGHEGGITGWATWALKDPTTGTVVVSSVNACCGGVVASLTLDVLKQLYPETFATGPLLQAGKRYVLSPTTSFTTPAGWRIDKDGTTDGISLKAAKPSVVFDIADVLTIPEGRTFESWTTLLRELEVEPGKTVGPLTPFSTASGLQGSTYTTRSVAGSTQTWFVTNGKQIARLDSRGSATAVASVRRELDRMARSITMTAP